MSDMENRWPTPKELREGGSPGAADAIEHLASEVRRLRNVLAEIHNLAADRGDRTIADLADRALSGG